MSTEEVAGIEHNKFVRTSSRLDITNQFSRGQAVIWYRNGGTSQFIDRNSSFAWQLILSPRGERGLNVWGVSTRWTLVNPGWRSGSWIVYYVC